MYSLAEVDVQAIFSYIKLYFQKNWKIGVYLHIHLFKFLLYDEKLTVIEKKNNVQSIN